MHVEAPIERAAGTGKVLEIERMLLFIAALAPMRDS